MQAQSDVETALHLVAGGHHEWAAFVAQQAAEKAVKAVLQARGHAAWGHVVADLLDALAEGAGVAVGSELRGCARRLDKSYIGARYPDGWAGGAPRDHYAKEDADEAIACAREILRFCEALLVR